jgi:hypothetical protein
VLRIGERLLADPADDVEQALNGLTLGYLGDSLLSGSKRCGYARSIGISSLRRGSGARSANSTPVSVIGSAPSCSTRRSADGVVAGLDVRAVCELFSTT